MLQQRGFTLIEVVVVMVIVAALGVGITNFIGRSVQGVADTSERQKLAQVAWIVSERVSRDLRDALPNSVRVNADASCLEFIPTIAGTDYLSVPVSSSSSSFEVVPFVSYSAADLDSTDDRVAVYPSSLVELYSTTTSGVISPKINGIGAGSTTNALEITLSAAHQFSSDSPARRLYVVHSPKMYCFQGSQLQLYGGYGFQNTLPDASGMSGVVVGTDLASGSFSYAPGTQTRSGVVTFSFVVSEDGDTGQAVSQEIQVRNVP